MRAGWALFGMLVVGGGGVAEDGVRVRAAVDRGAGEIEVRGEGVPGNLFRVERSADGTRGSWSEVVFGERADGVVVHREALGAVGGGDGFFRVRSGPGTSSAVENYHRWDGSVRIGNGLVEAVVVPLVARIMQFQFVGDEDGPFWEKRSLDGRPARPGVWSNFGGDKVWPSPQADFSRYTGRGWPPPGGFDATPAVVTVAADGASLTMSWPEDPEYGVTMKRVLRVLPLEPVMEVVTTLTRTSELDRELHTRPIAAWVVTQVDESLGTYMPVREGSRWERRGGYVLMSGGPGRANLETVDGLVRVRRSAGDGFKIGSDAYRILSVYDDQMLLMDTPVVEGAEYARTEQFSVAQVYSNGGTSDDYLEMEFHGPQAVIAVGESVSLTVRYELMRRLGGTADEDARAVLGDDE